MDLLSDVLRRPAGTSATPRSLFETPSKTERSPSKLLNNDFSLSWMDADVLDLLLPDEQINV